MVSMLGFAKATMKKIKLKVRLNKGQLGISVKKMSAITGGICTFLDTFCEDLSIKIPSDSWLATKPNESSFGFTVESPIELELEQERIFSVSFLNLVKNESKNGHLSNRTYYNYSKIIESAGLGDTVEFGFSNDEGGGESWLELTKEVSSEIGAKIQRAVEERGAIQGVFHSVFFKAEPPYFMVRELSTGDLVKCVYNKKDYNTITSLIQKSNGVVHIAGLITWNTLNKKIDNLQAEKFEAGLEGTDQDFDDFFGCDPNITGGLPTGEYVRTLRGDEK